MIPFVEFKSGRIVRFDDILYVVPVDCGFVQMDGRIYYGPYVEYRLRAVPTECYRSEFHSDALRTHFLASYRAWLAQAGS